MFNWSIRLFRISGIQLAVHSSFFLLLAYVAWLGWTEAVSDHQPGYIGALVNCGFLAVFFVCVVLHELGHATAARHFGIRVPRILLLPVGGMAQMEAMPKSPSKEFVIAIAGPAVNFLIIGLLMVVAPFPSEQIGDFVRSFLGLPYNPNTDLDLHWPQFLMATNLLMGCFNLIPVFPMDGGRVFRAFLASRLPYTRATFIAATVAKILAGLGILAALFWYQEPRIQMAILFVFIFFAGEAEYRMVKRQEDDEARWRRMLEELESSRKDEPPPIPNRLPEGDR